MLPIVLMMNRDSDRSFVEKLYHQYRKNIYASAFKILRHKEDTEDCVQDVIQTVIRHVDTFRNASRDELIKLLAVCTRNAAINIYRKNKRKQERESHLPLDREYEAQLLPIDRLLYHQQDPAEIVVGKENKRELVQMIAEMDDVYKDVLLLRYQYKMSNRKIADILKISENAVGVRLHRAKKILLKEREAELNEIRKNGSV